MNDPRPLEVEWYRQHGKHPERIALDSTGLPYVVGDWSWNRQHPDKQECVEPLMQGYPR